MMKIAVIGLGLIGGSLAKSIKKYTPHQVAADDISAEAVEMARRAGDFDGLATEELPQADLTLIALYPSDTVAFMRQNAHRFKAGSTVVDMCGVKRYICQNAGEIFDGSGVTFIGGHPMAGREQWGFAAADAELFQGASMILTPFAHTPRERVEKAGRFFLSLGFAQIQITTDERHDQLIAYTSQLAHIVSSAYVKSPAALDYSGFAAGSFKDLTRVAKLNEQMWSELFLLNGDQLAAQIGLITENLRDFKAAIEENDRAALTALLREGREIKERLT